MNARARSWLLTARAAARLIAARSVVAVVPFRIWRGHLGCPAGVHADSAAARLLAAHVVRAAGRAPFNCKCLVQAMALSWQMRRRSINHRVVIAVRPQGDRDGADYLHAWVEDDSGILIGNLPGPWHRLFIA